MNSLIFARAHNWDQRRIKHDSEGHPRLDEIGNTITEEYDDLAGDRPSCYSGVKRRLFQAVQGHPLLMMLTQAMIDSEIHDFVRQHFTEMIRSHNPSQIKIAWDKIIEGDEMTPEDRATLKTINITKEQQQSFIQSLAKKYGGQFKDEPAFAQQIHSAFLLKGINDAHILNFGHVGIAQLLKEIPSSAGMTDEGMTMREGMMRREGFFNETSSSASSRKSSNTKKDGSSSPAPGG